MKKIINCLLIKAFNIFMPVFLFILGICIGLAPIVIVAVTMKGWVFALLLVTVPLATVIISITNNITDWENLWNVDDIIIAINEYQRNKERQNDN